MIWISIILGIIEAVPTMLAVFKDIVQWIQSHQHKDAKEGEFRALLTGYLQHQDVARLHAELVSLKQS